MHRFPVRTAVAIALAAGFAASAHAAFVSFKIRDNPTINESGGITEFLITAAGQKAALGSSDIDGHKLSDVRDLQITRLDDINRFAPGSGPRVGPYLNFWITDGAGNYAVVANEPSDPEWSSLADGSYDLDWSDLAGKRAKLYEFPATSIFASLNSPTLTFNDLANFVIKPPTVAELTAGLPNTGTGLPREFGTNIAYGVNWVFGDTLANYVSGDPGYIVTGAAVGAIPEPNALALVGLAMLGAGWAGRRRTAR